MRYKCYEINAHKTVTSRDIGDIYFVEAGKLFMMHKGRKCTVKGMSRALIKCPDDIWLDSNNLRYVPETCYFFNYDIFAHKLSDLITGYKHYYALAESFHTYLSERQPHHKGTSL